MSDSAIRQLRTRDAPLGTKATISNSQADRLLLAINQKINVDRACELCSGTNWELIDQLGALRMVGLTDEGEVYSTSADSLMIFATLICVNCGNTKFLNLEALGFEPDPSK